MAAIATVHRLPRPAPLAADESLAQYRGPLRDREDPEILLGRRHQLVERCLGGEEAAWEDLVKVHTRRVYSICYRFTGSDTEARI